MPLKVLRARSLPSISIAEKEYKESDIGASLRVRVALLVVVVLVVVVLVVALLVIVLLVVVVLVVALLIALRIECFSLKKGPFHDVVDL